MGRIALLLLFLASLPCAVQAQNSSANANAKGKTYAVIVGVSAYQNTAIPRLAFATKDAEAFAAFLQSPAGGNLPDSQLKVLLDGQATLAAVYDALNWLKQSCGKDDEACVYFSGHGDLETANGAKKGFLLAYDSPQNNYPNNAVEVDYLNETALFLTAQKGACVVFVTDACHSGKLAGDFFKGKDLVGEQLRGVLNNQVRLTACTAGQKAQESEKWGGRGVFSYYLLQGLNGGAARDAEGRIRLQALDSFLSASFRSDAVLASKKEKQTPVTDGPPSFVLSTVSDSLAQAYKTRLETTFGTPAEVADYRPAPVQPIDLFFRLLDTVPVETYLNFQALAKASPADLPNNFLDACFWFQDSVDRDFDSTLKDMLAKHQKEEAESLRALYNPAILGSRNTLRLLKAQIKNASFAERFTNRFLQCAQGKAQRLINAYIDGDLAELEKRQYYSAGRRTYGELIQLLNAAANTAPAGHPLAKVLQVDRLYLTGLVARLNITLTQETGGLLKTALAAQTEALRLEPSGAYILNELGNLAMHKKDFVTAGAWFQKAADAAPSWAIPWSNRVRLYNALKKWKESGMAAAKADSLQPGLSYVAVNLGAAMERSRNWLAAETAYRRAIRLNNVHYLPYERLAGIYLKTGRFGQADYHYYLAQTRKQDFALNDAVFKFGIEAGGLPGADSVWRMWEECASAFPEADSRRGPFIDFLKAMRQPQGAAADSAAQALLQRALRQLPAMPLVRHYLAKLQLKNSDFANAEKMLLGAVDDYAGDSALTLKLRALLPGALTAGDSCLLVITGNFRYDVLEDHYLLAKAYEKQSAYGKAVERYRLIMRLENERQMRQAKLIRMASLKDAVAKQGIPQEAVALDIREALAEGTIPVTMGGAVTLARLYESRDSFLPAQEVLLQQLALNRAAVSARQGARIYNQLDLEPWIYFLSIVPPLEKEILSFYGRMTKAFPRDAYWYERVGLFLYNRMKSAYDTIRVSEYGAFLNTFDNYEFPWSGREKKNAKPFVASLPGTEETLRIESFNGHPLALASHCLSEAIHFSGDAEPRSDLRVALADVQNWYGHTDTALLLMKEELARQPRNAGLRRKLVETLVYEGNLTEAREHLLVLERQDSLLNSETLQAAEFSILVGEGPIAIRLLNGYRPATETERFDRLRQRIVLHGLTGGIRPALQAALSMPFPEEEIVPDLNVQQERWFFKLYSTARLYALLKQNAKALAALKKTLEAGWRWGHVFDHDEAWNGLRKTPQWKRLLEGKELAIDYKEELDPDSHSTNFRGYLSYITRPFY